MASRAHVHQFAFVAYNRQVMSDDTDYFLRYVDPDPTAVIGTYAAQAAAAGPSLSRLRELSLLCEERYLTWREREPMAALSASRATYDGMAGQVEDFISRIAIGLVAAGHRDLSDEAMRDAEQTFGYLSSVAILRRGVERLYADSHGYDQARLDEMLRIADDAFVEDPAEGEIDYRRMRAVLGREDALVLDRDWGRRSLRDLQRRAVRNERKVINRSLRLSGQFLGDDTTRLFVSGEAVRITGRLATYEVRRSGDLMSDHGGAALSVYDRSGDVYLCRLCIYTKGVPLLDHLTSLFLHVRAGEEERILSEGNAYDVSPEARGQLWLVPHIDRCAAPARLAGERDGRDMPHRPLIESLANHFFDEIGDACPPMPETRSMLELGYAAGDRGYVNVETLPPQAGSSAVTVRAGTAVAAS